MKYGDTYTADFVNCFTKKRTSHLTTYKRAEWNGYHTDNGGNGLWYGDRQLLGTCQFTVTGCQTEKAAVAKIRRYITFTNNEATD